MTFNLSEKSEPICIICRGSCSDTEHVMYPHKDVKEFIRLLREAQQESDDPDATLVKLAGDKLI